MSLTNIFDDLEHLSDKWDPYFEIYERHIGRFRGANVNLVEVGVQNGGSLEMWSKYLGPNSNIVGIDFDPVCSDLRYSQQNISITIGDQGDPGFWDTFTKDRKIDILIDDGSHYSDHQILTFEKVFPRLSIGGIYVCEDCHTSYMSTHYGAYRKDGTFIEYAKTYLDVLHHRHDGAIGNALRKQMETVGNSLFGLHVYDSVVVFEKFGEREMRRVFPRRFL